MENIPLTEERSFEEAVYAPFFSLEDKISYFEFFDFVSRGGFSRPVILESILNPKLKEVLRFIKDFSKNLGYKISDIVSLLLEKQVFAFFSQFKWNFVFFMDILKQAYAAWKELAVFLPNLVHHLASKGFDLVDKHTNIGRLGADALREVKAFLDKNPKVKRISGLVLAGLLILIWMNMSFTGNLEDDFDFSDVLAAVSGKLDIVDFISSSGGQKTLILLVTGVFGLSFPWFSTPVNVGIAVFKTLAQYFKKKLAKDSPTAIQGEIDTIETTGMLPV